MEIQYILKVSLNPKYTTCFLGHGLSKVILAKIKELVSIDIDPVGECQTSNEHIVKEKLIFYDSYLRFKVCKHWTRN